MAHRSCPGKTTGHSKHSSMSYSESEHPSVGRTAGGRWACVRGPANAMEEDVEGQPQEHDLAKLKLLLSLTTSVTASAMFAIPQSNIEVCSQHVPSQGAAFTLKFVLVDCV